MGLGSSLLHGLNEWYRRGARGEATVNILSHNLHISTFDVMAPVHEHQHNLESTSVGTRRSFPSVVQWKCGSWFWKSGISVALTAVLL